MNIYLEKLFDKYNLSKKDRYEVKQIYLLLPIEKQKNLISNFETLSYKLKEIEQDINIEREILLGHIFDNITHAIEQARIDRISLHTGAEIKKLKGKI